MMFRGIWWHFPLFSLFYCLRIKASIVQLCLPPRNISLFKKSTGWNNTVFNALGFLPEISWIPASFLKSNIDPALINQVLVIMI